MRIHIVQKGDTLWKLAKKYEVDYEQLKEANHALSNPEMLMPGMKVKVPTGTVAVRKESQQTTEEKNEPVISIKGSTKERDEQSYDEMNQSSAQETMTQTHVSNQRAPQPLPPRPACPNCGSGSYMGTTQPNYPNAQMHRVSPAAPPFYGNEKQYPMPMNPPSSYPNTGSQSRGSHQNMRMQMPVGTAPQMSAPPSPARYHPSQTNVLPLQEMSQYNGALDQGTQHINEQFRQSETVDYRSIPTNNYGSPPGAPQQTNTYHTQKIGREVPEYRNGPPAPMNTAPPHVSGFYQDRSDHVGQMGYPSPPPGMANQPPSAPPQMPPHHRQAPAYVTTRPPASTAAYQQMYEPPRNAPMAQTPQMVNGYHEKNEYYD
ncbi:SafA/ExsA family spore coat assembly protein [Shouchella lonarensis]|uniref:Spore coat assembly protein SafA n=1 Tax=Shouchella lonarensis TaxID=1464122 RepID=A0A1G6JRC7_9BACI|nr:SafA/ExsA family spore coat assembly protein [Shouchella lonarensis]SDC21211.1 spore coat assembly protein SafA [Shouchella lonarensis]